MTDRRAALDRTTDELDEALVLLHRMGPEYFGGLANHGPMAAEALHHLDRPDAVLPWTQRYVEQLEPAPGSGRPLTDDEWPEALGRPDRYPDWLVRFERELAAAPWTQVVAWWAPVLVPGLWGGACHGAIRAAHAARALGEHESPARVAELARALAYWASVAEELPGDTRLAGPLALDDALAGVAALPTPDTSGFLITERVAQLATVPELPAAIDRLGPVTLSELTAAAARAYLANSSHAAIAFAHGVTGPAALRMLAPVVDGSTTATALGAAWRAVAVLLAAFGEHGTGADLDLAGVDATTDRDGLVDRAVANGDEHVIKLTAACLDEHAVAPDPAYLAAAADVPTRLGAR